jgi:hypothetical protein
VGEHGSTNEKAEQYYESVVFQSEPPDARPTIPPLELYDWEDGEPIEKRLIPIREAEWNDVLQSGWKLYPHRQALEDASQELTEEEEEDND